MGNIDKVLTILLRGLFAIEVASMFAILAYVQIFNGSKKSQDSKSTMKLNLSKAALGVYGDNFAVCQSVRSVQPVFFIFAW